jgi:type II secretory pathway pseudopilin PulG
MPRAALRSFRNRLLAQQGWTLVELLVGMVMLIAVFMAALPIIESASNTEGRIQTAAFSIADARNFSDRMLRDLRSTKDVLPGSNASSITVDTFVGHNCATGTASTTSTPCRVTYSCTGASPDVSCQRSEYDVKSGLNGPTETAIRGLMSSNIFAFGGALDNASFVSIDLKLPGQPDASGGVTDAIDLQDGTALRNR